VQERPLGDRQFLSLNCPMDIDFDPQKLQFHVIDRSHVSTFTHQLQFISSWLLPYAPTNRITGLTSQHHHLKYDQDLFYVTIDGEHQVYVYNGEGKLQQTIGSSTDSRDQGAFSAPRGITCTENYLFVCDSSCCRVQLFLKKPLQNYPFYIDWGRRGKINGKFNWPYSIHYFKDHYRSSDTQKIAAGEEGYIIIGDWVCVQIWSLEEGGKFLQKIGTHCQGIKKR